MVSGIDTIPYPIYSTMYSIPYTIYHLLYYVQYTIYYLTYTIYHILCTLHHMLYTIHHISYTRLCTIHYILSKCSNLYSTLVQLGLVAVEVGAMQPGALPTVVLIHLQPEVPANLGYGQMCPEVTGGSAIRRYKAL